MTGFGDPLFNPSQEAAAAASAAAIKSAARSVAPMRPIPISGRAPASIARGWRRRCRNCPTPPTNSTRSRKISALPLPTFISARTPARPRSSARRSPITASSISPPTVSSPATSKGVAEPSLVLSIPKQPSEFDDGLLTASEVAQLKLNADWVVLSACNTIAGDKPGAEALSGPGAIVLLCRRAGAAGVALGGRFGGRHAAHDIDLRSPEGRSETRPRRGAASGHAGLSQRYLLAAKRLSGVLGAVCADRRGAAR